MTLKDYILRWQEVYDKNQSRPTTYAAHGYIFKNHILPGLGEIPLSELTAEQVGEFLEERRRFGGHRPESPEYPGLGEHTMRHIHRLLQQCLDQAIRDGLIADNPARRFHYPKPKKVSANVLTASEVEDYLDAAERLGHLPMFLLALTAGLRQGELIALKWSDLDAKERTLTITEKRSVERRELVEYEGGTRIVSLTPEAVELLCLEHAKHPGSPLMFMHPATQMSWPCAFALREHGIHIRATGGGPAVQKLPGRVSRAGGQQFHAVAGGKNQGLIDVAFTGHGPGIGGAEIHKGESFPHIHAGCAVIEAHKNDIAIHITAE